MLDWSPTVSPATLLALAMAAVAFAGWLRKSGSREHEITTMREDLIALKKTRGEERDADRKEREAFYISVNAGLEMSRGNLSEHQRLCAERFATKAEMLALEDRTNKGMDRIVDRLEQISVRLESIGDTINKSLVTLVAQNRH